MVKESLKDQGLLSKFVFPFISSFVAVAIALMSFTWGFASDKARAETRLDQLETIQKTKLDREVYVTGQEAIMRELATIQRQLDSLTASHSRNGGGQ